MMVNVTGRQVRDMLEVYRIFINGLQNVPASEDSGSLDRGYKKSAAPAPARKKWLLPVLIAVV